MGFKFGKKILLKEQDTLLQLLGQGLISLDRIKNELTLIQDLGVYEYCLSVDFSCFTCCDPESVGPTQYEIYLTQHSNKDIKKALSDTQFSMKLLSHYFTPGSIIAIQKQSLKITKTIPNPHTLNEKDKTYHYLMLGDFKEKTRTWNAYYLGSGRSVDAVESKLFINIAKKRDLLFKQVYRISYDTYNEIYDEISKTKKECVFVSPRKAHLKFKKQFQVSFSEFKKIKKGIS